MSETKKVPTETVVAQDDSTRIIGRAKGFWEQFSKPIMYAAIAIIVVLGGWFGYKKWYQEPREEKAAESVWHAQQYFEMDSINLALKGDGQFPGFEKIASTYSGTKTGNLAKFYTGVCYLRQNNFTKAVSNLEDFSTDAKEIQAVAYARLADAYSELNKNAEAIEFYDKAGHYFPEQESLSSESLFRAGLKSEILGKNEDAIKYYKEIREKYGRTDRGYQIDKYLARLGVVE